jgi:hypothetical protein
MTALAPSRSSQIRGGAETSQRGPGRPAAGVSHASHRLGRGAPPARVYDGFADGAPRERVAALLEEHRGNINAIARLMGKDRTQIRRWLGRFGLDADRWR